MHLRACLMPLPPFSWTRRRAGPPRHRTGDECGRRPARYHKGRFVVKVQIVLMPEVVLLKRCCSRYSGLA